MHHKSKQRQKVWDDGVAPGVNEFFLQPKVLHVVLMFSKLTGKNIKRHAGLFPPAVS